MKLLISVLACFCVLHVNGQFGLSRFLSSICQFSQNRNNPLCQGHLPTPPPLATATTDTITTKPTTRFVPPTTTRRPPSTRKPCQRLGGRCSKGVFLADMFAANFLSASPINVEPLTIHSKLSGDSCNIRGIFNSSGQLLTGSCQRVTRVISSVRTKRQIYIPKKKDLAILMDESGSIRKDGFDKVKRIAAAIIRMLCSPVSTANNRVAVTSFDSQVHHHRHLISRQYVDHSKHDIADWIVNNILYNRATEGSTCLIDALNYVADTVLSRTNGGRGGNRDVEQTIILITDGCENCRNDPQRDMNNIRTKFARTNINMYIIGIGVSSNCQEMLNLLSLGRKCFELFYVEGDTNIKAFLDTLEGGSLCYPTFKLGGGQCN